MAVECGGTRASASVYELAFPHPPDLDGDGLYDDEGDSDGRRVTLVTDPRQDLLDRYGRLLAYVTTRQGVNLETPPARARLGEPSCLRPPVRATELIPRGAAPRPLGPTRRVAVMRRQLPPGARSANAAARRFRGRAIGNSASGPVAKHAFPLGAGYQLRFQDRRRAHTPYRLCAWMGGRKRGFARGRSGRRGESEDLTSYAVYNPQRSGLLIWR